MKTKISDDKRSCSCTGKRKEGNEDTKINIKEGKGNCMAAMKESTKVGKGNDMKGAKWFMLLPGLILITALRLSFLLNPEVVQILWLVIIGTILGSEFTFMLMITRWLRRIKKEITSYSINY